MLMSSSPGILDEDKYQLSIELAAGSSMHLHTQSYQRLFHMQQGASQHMEVRLQPGAAFCFLPHPSVPHASARFTTRNDIYLTDGCRLLWGEVLTCGRKLNGEAFCFSQYHSLTNVYMGNKLVLRENMRITPAETDITAMGLWEGFTHHASLIYIDEATAIETSVHSLDEWLRQQPGIIYGITAAPVKGLVIRLLGYKAEQLFDCLKKMASLLSTPAKPITYAY
jgi:urease accessory protein